MIGQPKLQGSTPEETLVYLRRKRHHNRKGGILEGVKINGKTASPRQAGNGAGPSEPDVAKLARLIAAYAPHDGSFELRIPGVHASRFSRVNKECAHVLRLPCLCIVAQGAKTVIVGQEVYEYDASRMIVFSAGSHVTLLVKWVLERKATALRLPAAARPAGTARAAILLNRFEVPQDRKAGPALPIFLLTNGLTNDRLLK